jgi:hypothetical protein
MAVGEGTRCARSHRPLGWKMEHVSNVNTMCAGSPDKPNVLEDDGVQQAPADVMDASVFQAEFQRGD